MRKAQDTLVIGLTGGILTGKSTVSGMLAELGAVIIDADRVGHDAYRPQTDVWKELVDTFGEWILKRNGEIDRKRLGDIVFHDPSALILLNQIMHPRMREMIEEELKRLRAGGAPVVVVEAAVLIEAKWNDLVDQIWVTTAPEEKVIDRLQNRVGLSEEQARARIAAQLPPKEKVRHADVVIDTDCDLAELGVRVLDLWEEIVEGKRR